MHVEIIVGSTLGATEYVADALSELLTKLAISNTIHLKPDLESINKKAFWLICTSTHGAGDLPDNIQPFAKQLKSTSVKDLPFAILGIGDSSYDTFCHGAINLESRLIKKGANLAEPAKHIDILEFPVPEEEAKEWLESWARERLC